MKYCEEYGALLDAYVDGELSTPDTLRVAEHLKTCGGCRSYVDAALSIRAAFPDAEDEDVPEGFASDVLSAVREGKAPREKAPAMKKARWQKWALPLAACLALAVIAGQAKRSSVRENFQPAAAMAQDAAATEGGIEDKEAMETAPAGEGGGTAEARNADVTASSSEEKSVTGVEEAVPGAENDASDENRMDIYQYVTSSDGQDTVPPFDGRMENALSAAPAMGGANAEGQAEHAISVTLTQEQGDALAPLLSDCTLEETGGQVVYLLTAKRFQEVLTELERLNVPASVSEAPEDAPYRLYIRYQ